MYIYNDYNGWSFITSEIPNFILPYFFPIPIILIRIADLVTPHQTVPRCSVPRYWSQPQRWDWQPSACGLWQ